MISNKDYLLLTPIRWTVVSERAIEFERQGLKSFVEFEVDEEEGYRKYRRIPLGGLSP